MRAHSVCPDACLDENREQSGCSRVFYGPTFPCCLRSHVFCGIVGYVGLWGPVGSIGGLEPVGVATRVASRYYLDLRGYIGIPRVHTDSILEGGT
jgi:hypothetical protein